MSLQNRLNKADEQFEQLASLSQREAQKLYNKAELKILAQFRELFDRYDNPSNLDIKRTEVLELQRSFLKEISSLNITVSAIIGESILTSLQESYSNTIKAFENSLKVEWNFPSLTKDAITFVKQDNLWLDSVREANARLIINTKRELDVLLATNARKDIVEGLAKGKPYREVSKALQKNFGIAKGRADRITFTEMHKGFSKGRNIGIENAQKSGKRLGIEIVKVWKHNGVGKPRPSHLAADGREADPETGLFSVGGEQLESPGLGTDPANNINCFPDFVGVYAPTEIEKAYKRYYKGKLIKITTRSGVNLTATPNHPIMTSEGWVGIGSLNNGDSLIKCDFSKYIIGPKPNINHIPVKFSEIFDFLNVCFPSYRAAGISKQFHGDGFKSDIDIILSKGFLWSGFKSLIDKPINNKLFTLANFRKSSFFSDCRFEFFTKFGFSFSRSFVSFFNLVSSFFSRHILPSNKLTFGPIANMDFFGSKMTIDNGPTNPDIIRELKDRHAGIISFDKVVDVVEFDFVGHVYNLQTVNNYYLVNNKQKSNDKVNSYLIAHNCHCSAQAEIKE